MSSLLARPRPVSLAIGMVIACSIFACTQVALAVFNKTVPGGPQTIASATFSPPTKISANQTACRTNKPPEITVGWSASASSYVNSYALERATSSTGPYSSVVSLPSSEISYTDSSSLGYSTTYYYRVSAVYRSWTATSTIVSVKTLSKSCS